MKLVIFGSTGSIGTHVVEQALEQGYTVTAFVRNPNKLNLQHPQLNIFTGDVMNPALVEEAVIGHDAAICILGSGKKLSGNVRSQGTQNIIQALEKQELKDLSVSQLLVRETVGAISTFIGNTSCLALSYAKYLPIIKYKKNTFSIAT